MPRNKDMNEKIRDERREQILYHALRLFVRKGLASTRMVDIAKAAGVSQGLAYHYYASKEEIFVELVKGAYSRMSEAARGLEQLELPPKEKLTLATEKLLEGFAYGEEAALNFLLGMQASVFEAMPAEVREIVKGRSLLHEVIAKIIADGQRDGVFKSHDPYESALVFWSTLSGLAIYKATFGGSFRAPDPRIILGMFM